MSSSVTLTLRELSAAAAWAEDHARAVHADVLPYADIRVFRIPSSGVADRAVVLCEMCDRVRVSNANHHDVTDYDAV
jgi:hypothetical protein